MWWRLGLTLLQFLAIMLVPFTSLDYAYVGHMIMAALVVVFTVLRDFLFFDYRSASFAFNVVHGIGLFSINALALTFVVWVNVDTNAENNSYVALVEYTLMKMVAAQNVFYYVNMC